MGWDRSSEFKVVLEKCSKKASRNSIEELTKLAMMDHRQVRFDDSFPSHKQHALLGAQALS